MSATLPPVLAELVADFGPLSTLRRDEAGAVTLHTPGVNVLALNATFVPDADSARLQRILEWYGAEGSLPLVASAGPLGAGEEVAALRVGTYHPVPGPDVIVVEQVSRLDLPIWTAVLTEAHGTPEWAEAPSRQLALRLEGDREVVLLMAYAGGEPVGALLWRSSAEGGSAHLWGTLDTAADAPLLNAAHGLGGSFRCSLPDHSPLMVTDEVTVHFTLLDEKESRAGP